MNNQEKREADDMVFKHFKQVLDITDIIGSDWLRGLLYSSFLYKNKHYSEMRDLLTNFLKEQADEGM